MFDTGNSSNHSAEYYSATGSFYFPLTDVGAYALSASPYGTFDQGGNVREWNESLLSTFDGALRGFRGGGWQDIYFDNGAFSRGADPATTQFNDLGFRVATVIPESNTFLLFGLGALAIGLFRRGPKNRGGFWRQRGHFYLDEVGGVDHAAVRCERFWTFLMSHDSHIELDQRLSIARQACRTHLVCSSAASLAARFSRLISNTANPRRGPLPPGR